MKAKIQQEVPAKSPPPSSQGRYGLSPRSAQYCGPAKQRVDAGEGPLRFARNRLSGRTADLRSGPENRAARSFGDRQRKQEGASGRAIAVRRVPRIAPMGVAAKDGLRRQRTRNESEVQGFAGRGDSGADQSRADVGLERPSGDRKRAVQRIQGLVQRYPDPPPALTCRSVGSLDAPSAAELGRLLVDRRILQASARSTDFSNILYRHVLADTRIGREYLEFVRGHAYPMTDFCIAYRGGGWNGAFREVQGYYRYATPRSPDMRRVARGVLALDRADLAIWDENELYAGGMRDPFVDPLTPRQLGRKPRGTVFSGSPLVGALLLRATDAYLSGLTLSASAIAGTAAAPVTAGATDASDVFQWGDASAERSIGDPNRFDALIVHWTRHYNEIFHPLDRRGRPNPLDPDLVKAMIYAESRFSETAASRRSSARGLTQVLGRERRMLGEMPAGVSGIAGASFGEPSVQIAAGIRILFEKYRGSRDWPTAIRDYNGSDDRDAYRDNVLRIYESHRRRPSGSGAIEMPYR
jgi:hypothetical protein